MVEDNKDPEKKSEEDKENKTINVIEEAKKVNIERKEILDREEKLQTRKEKLHAEEMVAGKGQMSKDIPKEETPEEYTTRVMKNE